MNQLAVGEVVRRTAFADGNRLVDLGAPWIRTAQALVYGKAADVAVVVGGYDAGPESVPAMAVGPSRIAMFHVSYLPCTMWRERMPRGMSQGGGPVRTRRRASGELPPGISGHPLGVCRMPRSLVRLPMAVGHARLMG